MTFSKPYSGTFTYKGLIPSSAMNAINNAFPDILDKIGDTITGVINVASAGELAFQSGSFLESLFGSFLALAGSVTIESTATFLSNANLTIGGDAKIVIDAGSQLDLASTSNLIGNVSWVSTQTSPSISQAISASAGQQMTIQAQGSSASFGGTLVLASGVGTSGNGKVELNAGSTLAFGVSNVYDVFYPGAGSGGLGAPLAIYPFQNSVNTQAGINNMIPFFASTGASGSNVTLYTLAIPNNTGFAMQITWSRRLAPGSGASLVSQVTLISGNNAAGTVNVYNQDLYTGTGAGASGSSPGDLSIAASSTNVVISCVAGASAFDWQVFLTYQQI
jgi:hypothetical protein